MKRKCLFNKIEPPLHKGRKKSWKLWYVTEQDVEEGFDEKGFDEYVEKCKEQYGEKTTQGCFVWKIHKKDLEKLVDTIIVLNQKILICLIVWCWVVWFNSVLEFICLSFNRGGQFQHGKLTKDHSKISRVGRFNE